MIAVVGRPAQRQLRHVSGSDDHAAALVGNVHEHLRPLSCLAVLIGHRMIRRIMTDVREMLVYRRPDIDFLQVRSQDPRQLTGIGVRPIRGAEAGHGHSRDEGPLQRKKIEGPRRH